MATDREAIDQAAAAWVVALDDPDLSADRRVAFEAWLDERPAHQVAYARMSRGWERSRRLLALATPVPEVAEEETEDAPRGFGRRALLGGVAAAIAVAVSAGFLLTDRSETYATAVGGGRRVALPGGATMQLNTATNVRVVETGQRCVAEMLSGEAAFAALAHAARALWVEAAGSRLQAVDAAFNVRLRGDLVEVLVTAGRVIAGGLSQAGGGTPILAGQGAMVAAGRVTRLAMDPAELRRRLAWRSGLIELNGETLEQAVAEFNRYSDVRIDVAETAIGGLRVGGTFATGDARRFVRSLGAMFGIRAVESERGVIHLFAARNSSSAD